MPRQRPQDQRLTETQCCPSSKNCTEEIVAKPRCANETWDLFDNGGYFCCERGLVGYATTRNSDGCASPGYTFEAGEEVLPVVRAGKGESSSFVVLDSGSTSCVLGCGFG